MVLSPIVIVVLIVGAFLGSVEHDEAARYFKMRAYAEAERRYAVLAAMNSEDLVAALGVADAIAKQDDGQRAAASYQLFVDGVLARPKAEGAKWARDLARASNAIGVVATRLGRWDDAEAAFERAVAHDGAVGLYRANLAFAFLVVGEEKRNHRGTETRSPEEQKRSGKTEGPRVGAVAGAGADAGAEAGNSVAARVLAVLKEVKATDAAAVLASLWKGVAEASARRTAANWWKTDEARFRACRPEGEAKTAGLVYAVSTFFRADTKVAVTVCERDAVDIDVYSAVGPGRGAVVFGSVRSWAEMAERVAALSRRASESSR